MSKRKPRRPSRDRDPYQAREAKKYANPIPSREFILGLMEEHGAPLRFDDLAEAWRRCNSRTRMLSRRVCAMARDGQVVCNRGWLLRRQPRGPDPRRVIGHPDGSVSCTRRGGG